MHADRSDRETDQHRRLRRQWRQICERLGLAGDTMAVCEALHSRYTESWRAYHNLAHIEDCLEILHLEVDFGKWLDVEVAILFHDAVYVIGAADNEERSAELARTLLTSVGATPAFVANVVRLIRATDHRHTVHDDRERVICDIDLSILGRDPDSYYRYAAAICREVGLPEREYAPHRQAFLRNMLAKERIFHTDRFVEKYEPAARTNMQRELRNWETRLGR